jgi:surface antigen
MKSRPTRPVFIPAMLLVMLLGLFAFNAAAINLMFLSKEAPARNFSDADWEYLNRAIGHALENVEDGAAYQWNNPASPASGLIEVLESTSMAGKSCRRARLTNFYDQLKGVIEFVFCKQPDGEWKVVQ